MRLIRNAALVITTAILLMSVSLYNGFPLAEDDSAAYIEQAMHPHFTADRTPFYGLFMRLSGIHTSLWITVLAQCLLMAYLLLQYVKIFHASRPAFSNTLLTAIIIAAFTSVSWICAFILPDIFTGILMLSVFLFMMNEEKTKITAIVYGAIIFAAILMHGSNLLVAFLFAAVLLLRAIAQKQKQLLKKSALLVSLACVAWLTQCSMNFVKKHGFTSSRGSDIYMMARLTENGILGTYLIDQCGKKNYPVCQYKDKLPGTRAEFLTSGESPMYKTGGWDTAHAEYSLIIHDVFTTPKYLGMFIGKSVTGTLKSLTHILAPDKFIPHGPKTETWQKVNQYLPDEIREYNVSLQNTNVLSSDSCNFVYCLFFIFSSLWLLFMYQKVMDAHIGFLYSCIVLFLLINAFVTATFASAFSWYQERISWIIPATNAIIIINYYKTKAQNIKLRQ